MKPAALMINVHPSSWQITVDSFVTSCVSKPHGIEVVGAINIQVVSIGVYFCKSAVLHEGRSIRSFNVEHGHA
jgi:hypothetical protein